MAGEVWFRRATTLCLAITRDESLDSRYRGLLGVDDGDWETDFGLRFGRSTGEGRVKGRVGFSSGVHAVGSDFQVALEQPEQVRRPGGVGLKPDVKLKRAEAKLQLCPTAAKIFRLW